jgi:hypothetical protein
METHNKTNLNIIEFNILSFQGSVMLKTKETTKLHESIRSEGEM